MWQQLTVEVKSNVGLAVYSTNISLVRQNFAFKIVDFINSTREDKIETSRQQWKDMRIFPNNYQ